MSSPTVRSMKSTGCGKISVRSLTHTRRLHDVLFLNEISLLVYSEQLGVKPPYYVWGGQPVGLAPFPIRMGYQRAPPEGDLSDDDGPTCPGTMPPPPSTKIESPLFNGDPSWR
jgi:hypothetical protein